MEQLNKTPTTGKFGDVAKVLDTNFGLIVMKLMELSKAKKMNCGFYSSETELKTAYPNPDKGMMAYVGSGTDFIVYRCKTDGTWTATSETFKVTVDLSTYATKDALAQVKGSVDSLLLGAVYGGIASRTTNPGTPKTKVFYLPTEVGEYPNFGYLSVVENEIAFLYYDGTNWTKQSVDFSNNFNEINGKLSDLSEINLSSYPELTDLVSELYLANTLDGESYGLENIYVQDGRVAVNIKRLSDGNLVATYDSLTSQIPSDSLVLPLSPREGYNENGYIVCDVSKHSNFHDKDYSFNTNVITNIKNSPLIQKYVEELKTSISENYILRDTVKELYLIGASSEEIYGINNFLIQGDRHVINVSRKSDGKIIASADVSSDWDGILELKEKNNSGVSGFAVVDWNNYTTKKQVYPFNNSYILSLVNNPSVDSYIKSLKVINEIKICTDNDDINDIIEAINIKSLVTDSVYTIHNIMNYEGKYVFEIYKDGEVYATMPRTESPEKIVHFGDITAVVNWKNVGTTLTQGTLNNKKINSVLVEGLLENINRISGNYILRDTVKELYLIGASSEEIYGINNFLIQGDRHVINVSRKSDGKIIASADVSSDWDGILELKEKNNSGVSGFAVVDWDNYTTNQKLYSFNNSSILSLANNPSIDSYIKSLKTTEGNMSSVKRITERITEVDKHKLVHWEPKDSSKSNIDALKLGNFIDANKEGFLPTSDATTNVATMNRLLAGGGTIIVSKPGEYEVNGRMVLQSNTTLVFAEGVIIKMVSNCPYVLINAAAFKSDGSYDENIKVIGYHLNTNGFNNSCGISGLRGYLTFFHVKHVYVSDVRCMWYKAHIFFVHCCDWEDVEFANCFVIGDKDAFHFGRGFNGYLHDLTICAVDDSIALNAWDFADSNPQIGDIHDVLIENIVELPHYYNVNSEYNRTLGFTTRFLNGSWLPWTSGMEVQHSTTVTYKNNIYRVINLQQKTAISTATPSESLGSDGIQWRKEASGDNLGCCCYNIELRNIVSYQTKNEGNFGFNAINEVDHKSWVEGATPHPNHDIHFSNIQVYDNNSTIFNIQGDVDNVYVDNSILDITTLVNGMIYMNPRFENENFTKIPTFSFYDSLYIIGDSGVIVKSNSSNRDTITLNYRGVRLSSDKSKLIYTENTTVNTIKDYDFPKYIGTHANIGDCKFSLTLNKPIWWNGKSWVNSVGEVVHKVEL
jgi:hypothetical protein